MPASSFLTAGRLADLGARSVPIDLSDLLPDHLIRTGLTFRSLFQVAVPTTPSATRFRLLWKLLTALVVFRLKMPDAGTQR